MKKNITRIISCALALICFTACGGAANEADIAYETVHETGAYNIYDNAAAEDAACEDEAMWYPETTAGFNSAVQGMDNSKATSSKDLWMQPEINNEEYNYVQENDYLSVTSAPLSTFSADVDTASYTNIRRMIYDGTDVHPDAVRIEEMINYFDYNYSNPAHGEPFAVHTELSDCPWNEDTQLLMVGINTKDTDSVLEEREPMNLVFLIDVSGSMYSNDKLPLVQKSFSLLTENLSPMDRISIVTYAGADEVLLEGADGNDADKVLDVINSLEAGGSTAGAAGIITAYEIAEKYYIEGGNNRIILATDGDLNVGLSTEEELTELVEDKREGGVFLSVLGFGTGNYKDDRLEAIADHGNGNYSYIDSEREAQKVLVDEMSGTLCTVAKDVKFQVEFNPANVKGYRLIGYENRKMADEDFNDDTKDAGEIGAGHSVTVLYEIVPVDSEMNIGAGQLKYSAVTSPETNDELLTVNIRYKEPDGDESKLLSYPVEKALYNQKMSENMTFAAGVAEFGMLLRNSRYSGNIGYDDILDQLSEYDYSDDEFKNEFTYLVNTMNRRTDDTYRAVIND